MIPEGHALPPPIAGPPSLTPYENHHILQYRRLRARCRAQRSHSIPHLHVWLLLIPAAPSYRQYCNVHPQSHNQLLIWRLQARRCNPVFYLCVGLEQLNFSQKFVSLRARRQAVSFARALLRHTYVVSLFHLVCPLNNQRPKYSSK